MAFIKRALISVTDKEGIVEFAQGLRDVGVEIISTGGTARAIHQGGVAVREVSEVTGFPEMLDGRLKTINPRIAGGVLAIRANTEHMKADAEAAPDGAHPGRDDLCGVRTRRRFSQTHQKAKDPE